ncbi:hypothetical protein PPTG_12602 [Phytophthora nicotianae INRA-310]|uniref:Uncharacterized protein n=1 Tax=Phytophthora nicotianae (strain INRA-310) TaxID=761204 RepID=W2Q0R4_PHYN3|nr:hypothetical protein PPTG_12602 [Phytophthora nicotianae INRA-310]ETN06481.1 hypothetical protein PPTG_12602 [Phytophthora nicotianae INRA-310]
MSAQGSSNAVVETIELSSSSSESEVTVGDTTVKPRPKLRTRRNKVTKASDDRTPDSPDVARPAKRRRETSKQIQVFFFYIVGLFFIFLAFSYIIYRTC